MIQVDIKTRASFQAPKLRAKYPPWPWQIQSHMDSIVREALNNSALPISQGWLTVNTARKWLIRVSQARACTGLGVG
jgi:hypothetical protein